MKILFLSSLYSPHIGGGAEIVLQRTVEGMQQRGHQVCVLSTGPDAGLKHEYVKGVKVYRAGLLNTYWHFSEQRPGALARLGWHLRDKYNMGMRTYLREVLAAEHVDLVVCHNLSGWSVSAWDEISASGLPLVQVLHDMYLMCPSSNMFKKNAACKVPCTLCRHFRQGHAERSAQVDAVVGVSQHLLGKAADIQVAGVSVEDVAAYAESLMPAWGGVGRYPVKAGRAKGWVHVDTRPNKSRWVG